MDQKYRLDLLLVKRGLVESREKAEAMIMAGLVQVDGKKVGKIALNKNINISKQTVDKTFYNYTLKLKLRKGQN